MDPLRRQVDLLLQDLAGYRRGHVNGWSRFNPLHPWRIGQPRSDAKSRPLLPDRYGFRDRADLHRLHRLLAEAPGDIRRKAEVAYFGEGPVSPSRRAAAFGISKRTLHRHRRSVVDHVLAQLLGDQGPRIVG